MKKDVSAKREKPEGIIQFILRSEDQLHGEERERERRTEWSGEREREEEEEGGEREEEGRR